MNMQIIVSDLLSTGMTQQRLADLVPCRQSTINAYLHGKRGKSPSFEIGRRLFELHEELVIGRRTVRRKKKQETIS